MLKLAERIQRAARQVYAELIGEQTSSELKIIDLPLDDSLFGRRMRRFYR